MHGGHNVKFTNIIIIIIIEIVYVRDTSRHSVSPFINLTLCCAAINKQHMQIRISPEGFCWQSYNKTANGALRDAVHRHHQGVLYCRNVIQFHGTRAYVISFTSVRKARLSLSRFSRNSRTLKDTVCISRVHNYNQIGQ